jgi:hypothetical protein
MKQLAAGSWQLALANLAIVAACSNDAPSPRINPGPSGGGAGTGGAPITPRGGTAAGGDTTAVGDGGTLSGAPGESAAGQAASDGGASGSPGDAGAGGEPARDLHEPPKPPPPQPGP